MVIVTTKDLESRISNIKLNCSTAINTETGRVNIGIIVQEEDKLKKWIADFENLFIEVSQHKLKNRDKIIKEGQKLAEHAFFVYEVLCELEIEGNAAPPTTVRWEQLPSGVVKGELKSQALVELSNLVRAYQTYRQKTLEL